MLQTFSFGISTLLTTVGVAFAVFGIVQSEFKPAAIGLVLIFGAGVFATLFLGARLRVRQPVETTDS